MTTTSSANYDPTSTATQLATAYTSGRQSIITAQTSAATNTASALTKLRSALSDFTSSMTTLSGKKSLLANAATFSNTSVGTATATATAAAGSYAFFVERLASANQLSYSGLADTVAAGSGTLGISLAGGTSFNVDLAAADKDANGTLTPKEIAAAINAAPSNISLVTASILTINGQAQLVLTANATGANSQIMLDTSAVTNAAVKTALDTPANKKELIAAQDAIVWLGAQGTGTMLQQASNVYTAVDGVTMTFTKAQAAGENPVTLTVGTDTSATVANLQSFIDAYNKLHGMLASLTDAGDPSKNVAASIFANDAGVNILKNRMASTIRESVSGLTLSNYGITAARDGTLSLNSTKLTAALATTPTGLDLVFGNSNTSTKSGVMGDLDKYLNLWTNSINGQISQRQTSVSKLQSSLVTRQAMLDTQYNSAYQRYLIQFTQLQTLQAQMASSTSIFDSIFSSSKSN